LISSKGDVVVGKVLRLDPEANIISSKCSHVDGMFFCAEMFQYCALGLTKLLRPISWVVNCGPLGTISALDLRSWERW
jgi:hypothetical protein